MHIRMQDLLNKAAGHQSRDQAECEQSAHNCSPYFGVQVGGVLSCHHKIQLRSPK